jgi:hypothetical protein
MQLKMGTATVQVASSRRPADWRRRQDHPHFGEPSSGVDAFGGTPRAAGEDARAPQSNCMDSANVHREYG